MSNLWKDIRYTLRGILHSPGFAAVVVLSLGLGIGANTAIFTLINAVFLQPLPIEDASHVISIYTTDPRNPGFLPISYPNYIDYRDKNTVFSGLAASTGFPIALATDAQPIQIFGEFATGNFFDVLGVKAYRGRTFTKEEDGAPGAHPVVVLGHAFWSRQYGANPNVLGQTILLNGHPFTIIGVGPPNFKGTNAIAGPALWAPYAMYEQLSPWAKFFNERRFLWLNVAGRLKPGVSEEQTLSSLQALAHHLEQAYPDANQNRGAKTLPLTQSVINPNGRQDIVSAGGNADDHRRTRSVDCVRKYREPAAGPILLAAQGDCGPSFDGSFDQSPDPPTFDGKRGSVAARRRARTSDRRMGPVRTMVLPSPVSAERRSRPEPRHTGSPFHACHLVAYGYYFRACAGNSIRPLESRRRPPGTLVAIGAR